MYQPYCPNCTGQKTYFLESDDHSDVFLCDDCGHEFAVPQEITPAQLAEIENAGKELNHVRYHH